MMERHFWMAGVAPIVAAITAWASLNPYFLWGSSRPLLVASIVSGLVAAILYAQGVRPRWGSMEFAGVLLLAVFLLYLTALPRMGGGHVKWIFVLPTLSLLALLDDERRQRSLAVFATIFAVTLAPSLVVSLLAIGSVPLTFGTMPAANALMAAHGTRMLVLPGILFLESNSLVLPWGGVLFRLCGVYDEPGTVGTIAALLLAAHGYRIRQWRVALLYLAGLLSFSLAFAVLTTCGLLAAAVLRKRLISAALVVPVLAGASLAAGLWSISTPPGVESAITIIESPRTAPGNRTTVQPPPRQKLVAGTELRQTAYLDNRSLPPMEALVSDYFAGGPRIWLFGIASDASVVRGGVSQTWKRLLTDYGAIGFTLLAAGLALIAWSHLHSSRSWWVAAFLALYGLSIYQRPVVWMPYALLILLCGSVVAATASQPRPRLCVVSPGATAPRRRLAATFVLLASITLAGFLAFWFWRRVPSGGVGVQRLASPFTATSDARVDAAVQRSMWTEYVDYGTVRIGRVERPARLITGRKQWVRQLAVPLARARYEAFVGAIDAPATVRIGLSGAPPAEMLVEEGVWTRVAIDFDQLSGANQSVAVDVEVPPGGIAAWGSELLIGSRPDDIPTDVVLISLDTVRRDQLTPYAPSLPTTPTLAGLGREAAIFDRAISTSSWTIGSHATLFTGRFPADSLGYNSRVEPEELTLPEIFAASGYRTFGVSGGPYTDPRWGLHQGFDEYVASEERENASDATSRAIEWMSKAGAAPVFLFLNYFDAHEPLELSDEVRLATGVTEDVPLSMWLELDAGRRPVTATVRRRLLRAYGAELSAIDEQLRRLFEYLRRNGRWERTLVIVWSDHGQLLGERGYVGHAYSLEEELIRVPLIVKPPAGSPLGPGVHRDLIQSDDLFALSQTLAGLRNPRGARILTALDAKAPIRRFAFSKIHHEPLPELTSQRRWRSATQWAVHDGVTKVVRDREGRWLAYDVTGREERGIRFPGSESSLVRALDRFRLWTDRLPSRSTFGPLSPAELERLRSLGYIH